MDYYLGEMYVERLSVYMILISIELALKSKIGIQSTIHSTSKEMDKKHARELKLPMNTSKAADLGGDEGI